MTVWFLGGIEIWNRKYDGWSPSRAALGLLAEDPRLVPFVGPDFHTARQFFPLGMNLEVDALTARDVYDALRAGRCSPGAFGVPTPLLCAEPLLSVLRTVETACGYGARRLSLKPPRGDGRAR